MDKPDISSLAYTQLADYEIKQNSVKEDEINVHEANTQLDDCEIINEQNNFKDAQIYVDDSEESEPEDFIARTKKAWNARNASIKCNPENKIILLDSQSIKLEEKILSTDSPIIIDVNKGKSFISDSSIKVQSPPSSPCLISQNYYPKAHVNIDARVTTSSFQNISSIGFVSKNDVSPPNKKSKKKPR